MVPRSSLARFIALFAACGCVACSGDASAPVGEDACEGAPCGDASGADGSTTDVDSDAGDTRPDDADAPDAAPSDVAPSDAIADADAVEDSGDDTRADTGDGGEDAMADVGADADAGGPDADAGDGGPDIGPDADSDTGDDVGDVGDVPIIRTCSDGDLEPAPGIDGPWSSFHVHPFLQQNEQDSVYVVWELEDAAGGGLPGTVEWGCTDALPNVVSATVRRGGPDSWRYEAQVRSLDARTRYRYRVRVGDRVSTPHWFQTRTPAALEADQQFVVMSDMQPTPGEVATWTDVVTDGVIGWLRAQDYRVDDVDAVILPGDLTANGGVYDEWAERFFAGVGPLGASAALWPVPGNHEYYGGDTHFFDYFILPTNGSPDHPEHWWFTDFGNVRLIGLDSNGPYRGDLQIDWLIRTLDDACDDTAIDFVFAQLHHPHRSELWLAGETGWSGRVIEALEDFTTDCGKPSVHFFGHTHAYSRGASRDHRHVAMNVATAGGNIDYFGEYASADYTEFSRSDDAYGFVVVETSAGDDPILRFTRVSRGDESVPLDNVVFDAFSLRLHNTPPDPPSLPELDAPVSPECPTLPIGAWSDPDGDAFGASRIQVAADCDDFTAPLADVWWQAENVWDGVDTLASMDATRPLVPARLAADGTYCYRAKVRDAHLGWSEWSAPRAFETASSALGPDRLQNGDAEDGTAGWDGDIESIESGDCAAGPSFEGGRHFAVGGVCSGESAFGQATQVVDLTDAAAAIDAGRTRWRLTGWLRDWAGDDTPSMRFELLDADGAVLATSATAASNDATWTPYDVTLVAPAGTRAARIVLEGTRAAGSDNDSYFDGLAFAQVTGADSVCPDVRPLVDGW